MHPSAPRGPLDRTGPAALRALNCSPGFSCRSGTLHRFEERHRVHAFHYQSASCGTGASQRRHDHLRLVLISPQEARRILAERTADCLVRAAPDLNLSRYAFQSSNHVIVGDVAVRGYKHKQRWRLDLREIERAAHRLASLDIDPDDLVAAWAEPGVGSSWRSRIAAWMDEAAYVEQAKEGCLCDGPGRCDCNVPNAEGLGCGLTWGRFMERCGNRVIAGTNPLHLLTWSGMQWTVPAAYAALLDRSEELERQLADQAGLCSGCGSKVDVWGHRTSSATGFTTVCAACAASRARPYSGHLTGVAYASLSKRSNADAFLCCVCPEPRRALYWDHCHEHGFVRGPVCASCNTTEGGGWSFTDRPGGVRHLLRCTGCSRAGTLPRHHHARAIRGLVGFEPHPGCGQVPRPRWGRVQEDGSVQFELDCCQDRAPSTGASPSVIVPAQRVQSLLRDLIERAVKEPPAPPA